jgi:hypothetical protein
MRGSTIENRQLRDSRQLLTGSPLVAWISLWLLLIAGIGALVLGMMTDGGIAGFLLYQELVFLGSVDSPATHAVLFLPLVGFPVAFLAGYADRHWRPTDRSQMASLRRGIGWTGGIGLALTICGLVTWAQTLRLPDPATPFRRIVLEGVGREMPAEGNAVLVGVGQRDRSIEYTVVTTHRLLPGSSRIHRYEPITPGGWTPENPVHFVLYRLDAAESDNPEPVETRHGVLLRDQLPGFVRMAFTRQGLRIADDVMVHTDHPREVFDDWYLATAALGFFAIISWIFTIVFFFQRRRIRSQNQRRM